MFSKQINRRRFLTAGRNKAGAAPLRPPWSMDEMRFQDACTRCGDCLAVCSEHILIREGVNGYPIVDFKRGECTFCRDCVQACPSGALAGSEAQPWLLKAVVGKTCLAKDQVICMTCAEQCEARAIRFTPQLGAIAQPEINLDVCTGCGACVAPCPTQAIEVTQSEVVRFE